jgi:hypothetical protein
MAEYEKKVREILKENGEHFECRVKGDHDVWHNAFTNIRVIVDGKIKSRHTANGILKACGINRKL